MSEFEVKEELGSIGKYDVDVVNVRNVNTGNVVECFDVSWGVSGRRSHMFMNREQIERLYGKISNYLYSDVIH